MTDPDVLLLPRTEQQILAIRAQIVTISPNSNSEQPISLVPLEDKSKK